MRLMHAVSGTDLRHLALRSQAGDQLAFARLLKGLNAMIEARVRRRYAPGADRDDLRQEARFAVHQAVQVYDGVRPFSAIAATCVDRRLVDAVVAANRGKHRALNESTSLDTPVTFDDDAPTSGAFLLSLDAPFADTIDLRDDLRVCLYAIAHLLSPLERAAITALILQGREYAETADLLGVSYKAVDNAVQRARRRLVEHMADPYVRAEALAPPLALAA